jgi:outer membrane protein
VRALERALDAQQKSFQLGVSTIIDVLIAQRRLYQARSGLSNARYDYIRDMVTLRIRAGALALADIEEINRWMGPPQNR